MDNMLAGPSGNVKPLVSAVAIRPVITRRSSVANQSVFPHAFALICARMSMPLGTMNLIASRPMSGVTTMVTLLPLKFMTVVTGLVDLSRASICSCVKSCPNAMASRIMRLESGVSVVVSESAARTICMSLYMPVFENVSIMYCQAL